MHKILIVSDSHGLTTELPEIRKRHADVELALHCGDSELQINSPYLLDYTSVRGNCDFQALFPNENMFKVGDLNIYITHGHLFDVKRTLMTLQYAAMEKEADIVCFGHSHIAYAEKIDEQLFINPGSIRLPKKYLTPSYVILEWSDKEDVMVTFYEVNGEEITSFPYEKTFQLN